MFCAQPDDKHNTAETDTTAPYVDTTVFKKKYTFCVNRSMGCSVAGW